MKGLENYIGLALTCIVSLVSLYTAKTVSDLKVWILQQQAQAAKEAEEKYVSKEVFEQYQSRPTWKHQPQQGD
jgi:hypothetical protein